VILHGSRVGSGELLDCGAVWVQQVWKMSRSAWNSELQQEDIEHFLPNDYLLSLTPSVLNYGVEVELPPVCTQYVTNSLTGWLLVG